MSELKKKFYELNDFPDAFRTFVQHYEMTDESWRESVSNNSFDYPQGAYPRDFLPIHIRIDRGGEGRKMSDITSGLSPLLVLSEKAAVKLSDFLNASGEFLDVESNVDGFVGYRVTKRANSCIDENQSQLEKYKNGYFVVGDVVFKSAVVNSYDLFTVDEAPLKIFVSDQFKKTVEMAGLQGFQFIEAKTT